MEVCINPYHYKRVESPMILQCWSPATQSLPPVTPSFPISRYPSLTCPTTCLSTQMAIPAPTVHTTPKAPTARYPVYPVQAVPPLGTPTTHTRPFLITHTRQCPIPLVQRHPLQPTLQETTGATTGQMTTKAWTLRTVPPNQCHTRNPYTGPQ